MTITETFSITYKRETEKEKSHSVVRFNGNYVGYFLREDSKHVATNETWAFVPTLGTELSVITSRSRATLVTKIKQALGI